MLRRAKPRYSDAMECNKCYYYSDERMPLHVARQKQGTHLVSPAGQTRTSLKTPVNRRPGRPDEALVNMSPRSPPPRRVCRTQEGIEI